MMGATVVSNGLLTDECVLVVLADLLITGLVVTGVQDCLMDDTGVQSEDELMIGVTVVSDGLLTDECVLLNDVLVDLSITAGIAVTGVLVEDRLMDDTGVQDELLLGDGLTVDGTGLVTGLVAD